MQLQEEHASKQRDHDKVVADSAMMLGDLQSWQERAEALLAELERERQAHAATQANYAAAVAGQSSLEEQQAAQKAAAEALRAAAQQREEVLLAEKAQVGWLRWERGGCAREGEDVSLWAAFAHVYWAAGTLTIGCCRFAVPACLQVKAALAAASAERDELQAMVQQAAAEMQAVQQKAEQGSSQQVGDTGMRAATSLCWYPAPCRACAARDMCGMPGWHLGALGWRDIPTCPCLPAHLPQASLKAEVARLAAQVADLSAELEQEQAARSAAVREAKEKADRLERLESEWAGCGAAVAWQCWAV